MDKYQIDHFIRNLDKKRSEIESMKSLFYIISTINELKLILKRFNILLMVPDELFIIIYDFSDRETKIKLNIIMEWSFAKVNPYKIN